MIEPYRGRVFIFIVNFAAATIAAAIASSVAVPFSRTFSPTFSPSTISTIA